MNVEIIEGEVSSRETKIGIVLTEWNSFVTDRLLQGALNVLEDKGFDEDQITVMRCPGAYEIPFTCRKLLAWADGVIALGAVIRGETPHFDYICKAVTDGILQLNMSRDKPVAFGVLTTDTVQQAAERADQSSKHGNKGSAAALALLKMIYLAQKF